MTIMMITMVVVVVVDDFYLKAANTIFLSSITLYIQYSPVWSYAVANSQLQIKYNPPPPYIHFQQEVFQARMTQN